MTNDKQITITVGASRISIDWRPQTLLISELWKGGRHKWVLL